MPEPLNYVAEIEPWNVYRLEDGSTVRVKIVMTRVEFHGIAPDGKPNYQLNFQQIVDVCPGEHVHDTMSEKKGIIR